MSVLQDELTTRYGISCSKKLEFLDSKNLFIKNGISIISSLAGVGKTTYMISKKKEWEMLGYSVSYINFDSSTTYGADMIESPNSKDEVEVFLDMIKRYANNKDILILDSLKAMVSYYGLNIEDNSNMYQLMTELRVLSKETKCSIILVHHVYEPKNLKTGQPSFYGSRAIEEQSDSAFIFQKDKVKIVKSRAGYSRDEEVKL